MALSVVTANGTSLGGPTATQKTASGGLQNVVNPTNTINPAYTMPVSTQIYNTPLDAGNVAGASYAPQAYSYADGSYAGSGAAGAAAARAAADTAAQYDALIRQLQGQEGRLDAQLNVGLGNITNSYNQGENRLNQGRDIDRRNYDTSTSLNMNQYSQTRTGIMNNTRATNNALQRLLGINGAGNSSAAYEQAPYAAGLQGTQNLSQAQMTYGNNRNALDTSWNDAELSYNNNLEDLKNQRYGQENSLRSSIAQTRASLLDRLSEAQTNKAVAGGASWAGAQAAQGGLQSRINGLLDSIVGLGNQYANPVLRTGDVTFKAPTLGGFSLGGNRGISQAPGAQGSVDPAFQNLFPNQDDEERYI
jgi:hypothetical protein